jgi:hypothetical protein
MKMVEYLKINYEAIQFTFQATTVKVLSTGIKQNANQTNAKQMFWWVQNGRRTFIEKKTFKFIYMDVAFQLVLSVKYLTII